MKFLLLSILMIGVGIGVVGCEHDDDEPQDASMVDTDGTASPTERKYELDFYGTIFPNGTAGPGGAVAGQPSGFFIAGDDGRYYAPGTTLPESFKVVGMKVWVLANYAEGSIPAGALMINIEIVEIRQR